MRNSFIFLVAVSVCALFQISAAGQSINDRESAQPSSLSTQPTQIVAPDSHDSSTISTDEIRQLVATAKRMLSERTSTDQPNVVTLAALDQETSQIALLSIPKDQFLTKGADLTVNTHGGDSVRVQIVRANGVNTAVNITDATGQELLPLAVQFPIVKAGAITEFAYYTSAHPALLSSDVTEAGRTYVRTMLDAAAERLSQDGIAIPADIVDVAEHLCVVEHTDHKRFLNEDATALFPEILSLYGLNQGDTFRYSVSTAGAGGMIQMIPRTYDAIREQHSAVALKPDFVTGMRDHGNALEAMLLYMNDTWSNLEANSEVQSAVRNGIATKPELLAAGYNSNPMRLPLYLKNGGAGWRNLIPAETQMYLQIYQSVDSTLQLNGRLDPAIADSKGIVSAAKPGTITQAALSLIGWFGKEMLNSAILRRML
jgi:hypothetical protein